jgi:Xaa-Pro aminopeptidase
MVALMDRITDVTPLVDGMRVIKSAEEIEEIERLLAGK